MALAISAMVAIIALYVFVLILLAEYKSTFDWVVLILSGLIFHATSIYSAVTWLGILQ